VTDLTPTAALVMEVLAARYRLGETHWTFDSRHTRAMRELEAANLIWWKGGSEPKTVRAFLTEAGRAKYLSATYVSPLDQPGAPANAKLRESLTEILLAARRGLDGMVATGFGPTLPPEPSPKDDPNCGR
jgi:hypothetical protein